VNPEALASLFYETVSPLAALWCWPSLLVPGIVLVAIDLARLAILPAIDPGFFLRSQLATVGLTVGMHFLIDLRLIVFQVGRLAGGQLAALDALRDAVLLVLLALADFTLWVGILHRRIVLVLVDLLG